MMVGLLLLAPAQAPTARAQYQTEPGPDGTPQFERTVERRAYMDAATDEVLTYARLVQHEADLLGRNPSPEEMKSSNLRKRLLDLRLMLDFNAYLFDPSFLDDIRGQVDESYEKVGLYKDLFDQSKLTGLPIDSKEQARRLKDMNDSLTWLRDPAERRAMDELVHRSERKILHLNDKETPRLWKIADVTPNSGQSSLATVALLSANILTNLQRDGLLVDDILDPDQEAHFHDVRKALRSALVLVDMFPTGSDIVGDKREPLAKLVDAFGDVNDASIAYHDAEDSDADLDERRDDLVKEYQKAQKLAQAIQAQGQLDAFVDSLTPLQLFDVDPFH
jgi:CHAD domain